MENIDQKQKDAETPFQAAFMPLSFPTPVPSRSRSAATGSPGVFLRNTPGRRITHRRGAAGNRGDDRPLSPVSAGNGAGCFFRSHPSRASVDRDDLAVVEAGGDLEDPEHRGDAVFAGDDGGVRQQSPGFRDHR